ncbi:unnamed protein product, partial [Ixodes persulcatus]
ECPHLGGSDVRQLWMRATIGSFSFTPSHPDDRARRRPCLLCDRVLCWDQESPRSQPRLSPRREGAFEALRSEASTRSRVESRVGSGDRGLLCLGRGAHSRLDRQSGPTADERAQRLRERRVGSEMNGSTCPSVEAWTRAALPLFPGRTRAPEGVSKARIHLGGTLHCGPPKVLLSCGQ